MRAKSCSTWDWALSVTIADRITPWAGDLPASGAEKQAPGVLAARTLPKLPVRGVLARKNVMSLKQVHLFVRGRVQGTEDEIADADLELHIVQWPKLLPKRARSKPSPKE